MLDEEDEDVYAYDGHLHIACKVFIVVLIISKETPIYGVFKRCTAVVSWHVALSESGELEVKFEACFSAGEFVIEHAC